MTGPGKRDDELRAAVAAGIRAITVESPGELARLERIAAAAGRRQPVMLRAAVSEGDRLERVRLVGDDGAGQVRDGRGGPARSSRGGPPASPHLELLGLHAFGASNVLDAAGSSSTSRRPWRSPAGWPGAVGTSAPPRRRRRRSRHPVRAAPGVARPRPAGRRAARRSSAGWAAGPDPARRPPAARAGPVPGRPGRAPTSPASSTARPSTARSWRSSTAASTTCSGRPSSARSTGSAPLAPTPTRSGDGPPAAGDRRRAAVLGARRLQPGGGHAPAARSAT